ncbi:16S rRNA (cytidine(1402)-2'-O)-methyltransferase [Cereibacter johrii]|uniref:16S rRNA (cytidine(1402)-2'-O)-methyltransferase n=1 Tax=Cereibacter johrii TaxID=445629 RepID=UPI000DCE510A|nr:16S rRNA (cytidine(1402)-2'-O)-methyltransferase [Cereibacter johrii]RAZ86801.1 16S rRNA (cytidine(1402)-2'-O)-methyltransferase [Cereibacter johrii]
MTIGEAEPESGPGAARPLAPGLHFIATPIGAARDITLRALDILRAADVLAAEDTRTLRHLMEIHGIPLGGRPLVAYHDHNGEAARPRLLRALAEGRSVAYASEAGTPLVADPGFQLGRAAIAAGHPVLAAPGPSAVLAALTVSGLPTDRFLFAGFPPATASARRKFLAELAPVPATLVLYESPKRIHKTLEDMALVLGDRQAAVCRELTKRFEEVSRGPLDLLARDFGDRSVKGEIVVVVDRAPPVQAGPEDLEAALVAALGTMSVKEAAAAVAGQLGLPRRDVYQAALRLAEER